jgi:septal ring factor EnvC (AmiA/AmiB activator)
MKRTPVLRAFPGAVLCLLAAAGAAPAQQARDLRDSQLRLDSIRQERARLQREMDALQTRVRDASREVANLARQRAASASALQELEFQFTLMTAQVDETTAALEATRLRMRDRTDAMSGRLRSIYKRGPLHTVRVLLSADNFADLLNRYKYLHLITLHDRRMVEDVARLERELRAQEASLRVAMTQLDRLRLERSQELAQLRRLEGQSQQALSQYRRQETGVAAQLEEAARLEAALNDVITRLERERLAEEERRRAAGVPAAPGSVSTRDLGSLAWPVEGDVIYRFGPQRRPSGVTLVNRGIGIAAPPGTPVRAVESGQVVLARPFEGYGPSVMVNHGAGYYTLYLFLKSIGVREGQTVTAGQVVGTVGGEDTPDGPHLYFQVHAPVRGGTPEAVDPLTWLRSRAGR